MASDASSRRARISSIGADSSGTAARRFATLRPMPRESKLARTGRARRILEKLEATHPDAHCELDFENPFQLLVATILSAQNTDKNVNSVTPALFRRYPDARRLARAAPEAVERLVHSCGFFRQKTRTLLAVARRLVEKHDGEVPGRMEDLVALPGVGRKTANVVLGNCFDVPGLVVDTHVARLARRWQLSRRETPQRIERDLMGLIPEPEWTRFSHAAIFHGRRICAAKRPRCEVCALPPDCSHPERGR
jgi:endonuclease-3